MRKIFGSESQKVDKLLAASLGSNALASMKPHWERHMKNKGAVDYKFSPAHGSRLVTTFINYIHSLYNIVYKGRGRSINDNIGARLSDS